MNGASFSLTANPGRTIFGGWSGACSGTQLTCSGTINGKMNPGVIFLLEFTLSVGRSNPRTVKETPAGDDRVLDCGGNCSAKFTTATPPDGKQLVNWTGNCSGISNTCTLTIQKDTSVQELFRK